MEWTVSQSVSRSPGWDKKCSIPSPPLRFFGVAEPVDIPKLVNVSIFVQLIDGSVLGQKVSCAKTQTLQTWEFLQAPVSGWGSCVTA